jgi:type VI secretion system protein ImpF
MSYVTTARPHYGMRDPLAFFEGGDLRQIERNLGNHLFFEPRIIRRTLQVKVLKESELESQRNPHRVFFQISADLWAQPMPEKFYAKTVVDLETGQFTF